MIKERARCESCVRVAVGTGSGRDGEKDGIHCKRGRRKIVRYYGIQPFDESRQRMGRGSACPCYRQAEQRPPKSSRNNGRIMNGKRWG